MNNYQKFLKEIEHINSSGNVPTLLLHSCCAPCSSTAIDVLSKVFNLTIFYYNPNLDSLAEYQKRMEEERRFISEFNAKNKVHFVEIGFNEKDFDFIKPMRKDLKEGGEACKLCYELRLKKTKEYAEKNNFDYFASTLTLSPLKNEIVINEIGERLAKDNKVKYLPTNFKKDNGYLKSIDFSKKFNLYRQDYCGCAFSKKERQNAKKN